MRHECLLIFFFTHFHVEVDLRNRGGHIFCEVHWRKFGFGLLVLASSRFVEVAVPWIRRGVGYFAYLSNHVF